MPTTGIMAGDSTWAATYESPPLPPVTILGMPILQHPQPQSAQASSGTILPFCLVPISQRPATAHPSTEPLPPPQPISSIEELRQSGTSPYRPISTHLSLYHLRNPSPAVQPSQNPTTAATGRMSSSSVHHRVDPEYTEDVGSKSPDSSDQSHNLHQSYSCPLSRDTISTSPTKQAAKAPSRSSPDPSRHSQTWLPSPMKRTNSESTPELPDASTIPDSPAMTLPDAIRFTREQLRISALPSQSNYDKLSIASFINLCLWVTIHAGLGGNPSRKWLFYEEKPRTPIRRHSTVWGGAEHSPPVQWSPLKCPHGGIPSLRRRRHRSWHPTTDARWTTSTPSTCTSRHYLLLQQRKCTTRNVPERLQTICRCGPIEWWWWRAAYSTTTTSHPHLSDGHYRAIQHLRRHPLLQHPGNSLSGMLLPTTNSNQRS